jgi:hypothetical protein
VKPRVPLFVVALLIGASTWTMHRSTSADAQAARTSQPAAPAVTLIQTDSSTAAARPAGHSPASFEAVAARSQKP